MAHSSPRSVMEKTALLRAVKYPLIASPIGAAAAAIYAAVRHRKAPAKQRLQEMRAAAIKGAVAGGLQGFFAGRNADAQAAHTAAISRIATALQDTRAEFKQHRAALDSLAGISEAIKGLAKKAEDPLEGQLVLNLDPKVLRQIQRAQRKHNRLAQAALEKTAIDLALAKNLLKLVFTMGFMKAVYDHAASSDE